MLGNTERALAKKLGITPKMSQETQQRSPLHKPKPCVIHAKIHCILCESETSQYFHMMLKDDDYGLPYLQSTETTRDRANQLKEEIPFRSQDIEQSTCSVCPEVLGEWTKGDLVRKLIEVFPVARAAMITGGRPHSRRF